MATQEQLKGNKKLAKFINCPMLRKRERAEIDVFQIGVWKDEYIWDKLINRSDRDDSYAVIRNTIPFHSDWKWLMKVVDRILELYPICIHSVSVDMESTISKDRNYTIKFYGYRLFNVEVSGKNHFDTLYKACIQFVDWYNKQNKKS